MEAAHVFLTASETWYDFCHVNLLWLFLTLVVAGYTGYETYNRCTFLELSTITILCNQFYIALVLSVMPLFTSRSNNLLCVLRELWVQ